MPIKISNDLPARAILEKDHIFVMTETRALHQDIRPLKILILNLMPNKIETETQLLRCLSNTPLQIEVTLMQTSTHKAKNTSPEHLINFYTTFEEVKDQQFDGLIITGAPVEQMPYEEVEYWEELKEIMDWSKDNVFSTLHICWGAQAGLYHHYGINKQILPKKLSGVFKVDILTEKSRLFHGMDDYLYVPQSRHTAVDRKQIANHPNLRIMSESKEVGVHLVGDKDGRQFFIMGHHEYDRDTLLKEYQRDVSRGLNPEIPKYYFPDDNPEKPPFARWHVYASTLFTNWLNYFVYQTTPYELKNLKGK
ncbi:MAG: homoserine O-succinyltransferase [Acutalibacteraceae bacterium]|nr:homoserine O-succinyltransferase [Acutalibacteraceae bacterium]